MLWMCTLASVSPELCFLGAHIPWTVEHSDLLFGKSLKCWFWGCFLCPSPWSVCNQLIKTGLRLESLSNSWGRAVSVRFQEVERHRLGPCLWEARWLCYSVTLGQGCSSTLFSFHLCTMGWVIPAMNPQGVGLLGHLFLLHQFLYGNCGTSWFSLPLPCSECLGHLARAVPFPSNNLPLFAWWMCTYPSRLK